MENKKEILYRCAKELFSTQGYKDTAVSDITRQAGFAVGTFYKHYPSKEKLFFEIFKQETSMLMRHILASLDLDDEPMTLVRKMMAMNAEGMLANPILRQWYKPDVFNKIEKIYRDENGLDAMDFLYRDFKKIVEIWQQEGKMRTDIGSEMIMAIFGAIIRIGYHKEEIGLQYFPALQEHLTDFVLRGLIDGAKKV